LCKFYVEKVSYNKETVLEVSDMRWCWVLMVGLVVAALVFCCSAYASGDKDKPTAPAEKVDLPVEKPTEPIGDEEEEEEDEEGEPPEDDEEDEDEEPPVEFFDEEVDTDKVVYVMDKTGSMNGSVGHPITDVNGNVINNPTKMQHIIAEFQKSVKALSENCKFSALFYSAYPNWAHSRTSVADDLKIFKPVLVKATPENKAAAIAWAAGTSAYGATPILQAGERALQIPEVETILLHTDGVCNVLDDYCYCDNGWCGRRPTCNKYCCDVTLQRLSAAAGAKGVKIFTFGHAIASFYPPSTAAIGEAFLKQLASATGGTYTKVN